LRRSEEAANLKRENPTRAKAEKQPAAGGIILQRLKATDVGRFFYKSGCPMQLRNGFGKEEKQLLQ
jgi:hypothetical protein